MSLTLRTSCRATAYILSITFSAKMAIAQEAGRNGSTWDDGDHTAQPTSPTGIPMQWAQLSQVRLSILKAKVTEKFVPSSRKHLGVEKAQITANNFDPVTGAVEFTISGDNAQAAGQKYLSLGDDELKTIGMKSDSAALAPATTDRANSSDENSGT